MFMLGDEMSILLVGFDSAWTVGNAGGLVAVIQCPDGTIRELEPPECVGFSQASQRIQEWQGVHAPTSTVILIDQPIVVPNQTGQRPVENLVAAPVSSRYGGVQPANIGRVEMFGAEAPVWEFLERFDGPSDPLLATLGKRGTRVFETYPVLAMISLGWMMTDSVGKRLVGRLPKYNPQRKKSYALADWRHVCQRIRAEFASLATPKISGWIDAAGRNPVPKKADQDGLDACMCLLTAIRLTQQGECLLVGDAKTGYMVVPYGEQLDIELRRRCVATGLEPTKWVRKFRMQL